MVIRVADGGVGPTDIGRIDDAGSDTGECVLHVRRQADLSTDESNETLQGMGSPGGGIGAEFPDLLHQFTGLADISESKALGSRHLGTRDYPGSSRTTSPNSWELTRWVASCYTNESKVKVCRGLS